MGKQMKPIEFNLVKSHLAKVEADKKATEKGYEEEALVARRISMVPVSAFALLGLAALFGAPGWVIGITLVLAFISIFFLG